MRRPRIALVLVVVLPALLLSGPQAAALNTPEYDRLYVLGADTDYLYWSADRFDPELGLASTTRNCGTAQAAWGIPGYSKPCLVGTDVTTGMYSFNLFSLPASVLGENVTWNAAGPLRFHIEAAVNTFGAPYTVHFILQKGTTLVESQPATQVSPGVWEGQITGGGPLKSSEVNFLTVRVESQATGAVIDLKLAGHTYLQLPRSYTVRGVPDLMREDVYEPQPTSYATATRSFTFNDADWASRSFTGTTGPARDFGFDIAQKDEIFLAWVELFDTSFGQGVSEGQPDTKKFLQGTGIRLLRDGVELGHSALANGRGGYATTAMATLDLTPGPVTLRVDSADEDTANSVPFTLHVLEIRGERTLRTMRSMFTQEDGGRTPVVGACPPGVQPIPATDELRSMALDLDWDGAAVGIPDYTFRFAFPGVGDLPCSEAGSGDRLRLTVPAEQVWYVGATPAYDATFYSNYDTTYEMSVRFTYSNPPAA